MKRELAGRFVRICFPVVLSRRARREGHVVSGQQPNRVQTLEIDYQAFTKLDHEERERVVELWERITIGGDTDEDGTPMEPAVIGYADLYWHTGTWSLPGETGERIELDEIFFASPGRTLTLLDHLRRELDDTELLEALLAEAPLLDSLGESGELSLDAVLAAYDTAFQLVKRIGQLARQGRSGEDGAVIMSQNFLFMRSREGRNRPVGLLHDSDPPAFQTALELLKSVDTDPRNKAPLFRFADEVCQLAKRAADEIESDSDLVFLMRGAANKIKLGWEAHEAYERERAQWIAQYGSERLRVAADRGYKHDGIYRDERLARDFPEFVGSLGKRIEVGEVVNPTAEAVELESEALERVDALGLEDVKVRIVWVTSRDFEIKDGEYIQLSGYLVRHTVFRQVREAEDDIPF